MDHDLRDHDDLHDHDKGLAFDLATLMTRRRATRLIAGAGLFACNFTDRSAGGRL